MEEERKEVAKRRASPATSREEKTYRVPFVDASFSQTFFCALHSFPVRPPFVVTHVFYVQ